MIPSLREPPFALGELGDRLPRKDELPPPPRAAEEIAPGVWRGPDGKLFTKLKTEEEEAPQVTQGTTDTLACKKPFVKRVKAKEKRELQVGDKLRILNPEANGFCEDREGHIAKVLDLSWGGLDDRISVEMPALYNPSLRGRFWLCKDPLKDRYGVPLESPSWEFADPPKEREPRIGDAIRVFTDTESRLLKIESEWWLKLVEAADPKKWEFVS